MRRMSKHSSSRLTPSRKNRRRPVLPDADWLDAMHDHCFHLDMLAELLIACGQPLEARVLEQIGIWSGQEVTALKTLLDQLEEEAAR
jgi:hypothetical protein